MRPVARRGTGPAESGTLRAVIFGVSDGLVSNLSLVMGVAGPRRPPNRGSSSWPGSPACSPGSFSMAAGEYISMQSQRELFERQIALERAEMEAMPEEEEAELAAHLPVEGLHRRGGRHDRPPHLPGPRRPRSTRSSARSWASTPTSSARRGAPPPGRSRPSRSARPSRSSRTCSAAVAPSCPISLGLSLIAPVRVGAGVSLLTGRGLLFSGARQLVIGPAAAAVTFVDRLDHRRRGLTAGMARSRPRLIRRPAAEPRASTPAAGRTGRATGTRAHEHGYDKVLVVAAGSIRFGLAGRRTQIAARRGRSPGPAGRHRPRRDRRPGRRDVPRGARSGRDAVGRSAEACRRHLVTGRDPVSVGAVRGTGNRNEAPGGRASLG